MHCIRKKVIARLGFGLIDGELCLVLRKVGRVELRRVFLLCCGGTIDLDHCRQHFLFRFINVRLRHDSL